MAHDERSAQVGRQEEDDEETRNRGEHSNIPREAFDGPMCRFTW